ncbi:Spy0128 family protein [Qiania dongpingensis]|uniref:Streptococcal pilin isopeptide linkage domain-containing protein n=1 Tax=Qiania dongpingensis TaxID=2763669 RepID=A0A7G9G3W5_9FIRM|nr:FctA domain-containing protein [Qiania dongpingensis]QNM05497.1 hypothetical protein H9Q78_13870 [Qiania dongpingensis]
MFYNLRKRYMGVLLTSILAVLIFPGRALAEERTCAVFIPVEIVVTGEGAPADEEYRILIEGENVPMPGQMEIILKGGGKVQLGPITYLAPGDYRYRISQMAGNTENFTYDTSVYTVTVRVINDGEAGLSTEIWAVKDESGDKSAEIVFRNSYKKPVIPEQKPTVTPAAQTKTENVKTGDAQNILPWIVAILVSLLATALAVKMKSDHNR